MPLRPRLPRMSRQRGISQIAELVSGNPFVNCRYQQTASVSKATGCTWPIEVYIVIDSQNVYCDNRAQWVIRVHWYTSLIHSDWQCIPGENHTREHLGILWVYLKHYECNTCICDRIPAIIGKKMSQQEVLPRGRFDYVRTIWMPHAVWLDPRQRQGR